MIHQLVCYKHHLSSWLQDGNNDCVAPSAILSYVFPASCIDAAATAIGTSLLMASASDSAINVSCLTFSKPSEGELICHLFPSGEVDEVELI